MKVRTMTVFAMLLLMGVVLAFGACSNSSTTPTGTSKGVVFEIDEDGNSSHPDEWEDLHQDTSPGEAAFCAGCHTSDPVPEPGCFNATLCHGADGDDSDEELEEDSDEELEEDSDDEAEEDSDEEEEDSDDDEV